MSALGICELVPDTRLQPVESFLEDTAPLQPIQEKVGKVLLAGPATTETYNSAASTATDTQGTREPHRKGIGKLGVYPTWVSRQKYYKTNHG